MRDERSSIEIIEKEKDQEMRKTLEERERRFIQELEKSKFTMNKMLEENIRDKNLIEKLEKELNIKDKTIHKLEKRVEI